MQIPDLGGLLLILVGLAALISLILLIALRPKATVNKGLPQKRPRRISLLAFLALFLLLWVVAPEPDAGEEDPVATTTTVAALQSPGPGSAVDLEEGVDGTDIAALLLIAIAAAAVLLYSARRGAGSNGDAVAGSSQDLAADLAPAIDEATERLRLGSEPRAAVIAAYAGLERALARLGYPRNAAETPTEHVTRVLAHIPGLADPAVRLGGLYEVARFSDHAISEADRRHALQALDEARSTFAGMVEHAR